MFRHEQLWKMLGAALLTAWFTLFNGWQITATILTSAILHELGHILVLQIVGGRVEAFSVSPYGAVIQINSLQLSYTRELLAVLAGSGINLMAAGMLALLDVPWAEMAAGANLILGIFNLLPAAPLDGWRILMLLSTRVNLGKGRTVAALIGGTAALMLAAILAWVMICTGGNLWLLPAVLASGVAGIEELKILTKL